MFGPPRPQHPHMRWGYQHSPNNPQWRHPVGPRAPFRGQHQRFNHPRPPFPSGNDNYWCETCDRGFPTEDVLNKHKQQHQKCKIDGCQFIAHPKVITKHIQMQHSTGLFKKIANIKNPEEIAKWREERRRKYPTKANIDKKAAELTEKIERGEKMGLGRNRNHYNKPNSEQENKPGQGVKRKFNARNQNQPRSKFQRNNADDNKVAQPKAKPKPTTILTEDKSLKPFAGILNLQMDSDNEIDNDPEELNSLIEDEDDSEKFKGADLKKGPENSEPVVCGALSSLICHYGSSEEEETSEVIRMDSKNTTQASKVIQNRNMLQQKLNCIMPRNAGSISLGGVKSDAKTNREFINFKDTVFNQPTGEESSVIVKHEATKDSTHLVYKAIINNDRSNSLEEKHELKEVNVRSTTIDNGEIHKDNSNDSGPQEVKTEAAKSAGSSDRSANTKYDIKIQKQDSVQGTINNDSDSGPEEMKADVKKEETSTEQQQRFNRGLEQSKPKDVKKNIIKRRIQANQHRRPKLPSTLLQKLLHKEMQQERNIVLQCIRYIRRNNYFDKKE